MTSSYGSSSLPFISRSASGSTGNPLARPLALARSILTHRRIALGLAQVGGFLCVAWVVLSWTGSSSSYVPLLYDSPALPASAAAAGYQGTFGPTSCPSTGCAYTRFSTAFDRILNGTTGPSQGQPIDSNRDRYEGKGFVFNPAILRMPPGSRYALAVLARGPSLMEVTDTFLQRRTIIAYLADLEHGVDVVQKTDSWMLDLRTDPSPGCEFPWGSTPGPEDPRAIWSPDGVPLMVMGMDTARPDACRTLGVMDLRVLWPALRDELERIGWPTVEESGWPAAELDLGSEVWFDGASDREKNWAAFFSPFEPTAFAGSLPLPYFHYDFSPQTLLFPHPHLPTPSGHAFLPYVKHIPSPKTDGGTADSALLQTCIDRVHGTDLFGPVGYRVGIHHATPFHPVTLRGRGKGKRIRTAKDTVLVGLAHAKFFDDKKESHYWYDRFVIVLNATAPFRPIGVSPSINISSLSHERFYFTQSITFLPHPTSLSQPVSTPNPNPAFPLNLFVPAPLPPPPAPAPPALSDGFLDDDVLIAMGEMDGLMGTVRLSVGHLLADVRGCGEDADAFRRLVEASKRH